MVKTLEGLAPGLKEGAIVTDVGSVKSPLVETLPGLLPPGVSYVGSHPMAGSHERGMAHARADLFEGATCVVTEMENPGAVERVCEFWRSLGAVVARRDAGTHDIEVAWVSHVPHVLAFAFARALESAPSGAMEVSGSGFRDFTRIARSDAELWGDILAENRKALGVPLQKASAALAELATAIESGDVETLERLLAVARETLSSMSPASLVGSETRKESQTPPSGPGTEGTGD
jgi:prephenate dehydrogenase